MFKFFLANYVDIRVPLISIPEKLQPASDNLTQQWLVEKISQLHCSGEVNMEHWLQNAPDRYQIK